MVYTRFSGIIPQSIILAFEKQLRYNNIDITASRFTGFLFLYSFFLAIGIGINSYIFNFFNPAIVFLASFSTVIISAYLLLKLKSEAKGKKVEDVLPDALQLIASNMKSGLTTERSLFVAARPEFESLQTELRDASKRISSGERVDDALIGITKNINSNILEKTMWLITQGIKSGGQIADLLFQLATDLKNQASLEQEARANISIYILLILFASVFGAPFLFGVSSFIVQVLSKQLAETSSLDISNVPTTGNLSIIKGFASGDRNNVTTEFIGFFSMVALLITSIFSALTIGVINSGKEMNGLKYMLPLIVGAFIVYTATRFILTSFLGNLV